MTVALTRPVPNLVGETRMGDTIFTLVPDTKRSSEFTLLFPARFTKLTIGIDGNGGAAPTTTATLRGLIYQSSVLLGMGDEVVITSGKPLSWVDLPFTFSVPNGVAAVAGEIEFGVLIGGTPNLVRVAQIDPDSPYGGGRSNSDAYVGGASNPYGSSTSMSATMSIFGTITQDWTENPSTSFDVIARMGFLEAQRLMAGGVADDAVGATASWHGTTVDDNRGSFAVVLAGGPLAGLVGQRVLITSRTHTRSVLVYVTAALSTLDADISLARRAFAELDLLSADFLDVQIQVVS